MSDAPNIPTTEGVYYVDTTKAQGWTGPSGMVEIVQHENSGRPWLWCYWIGKPRPRCGIPLQYMRGAKWTGPLTISQQ